MRKWLFLLPLLLASPAWGQSTACTSTLTQNQVLGSFADNAAGAITPRNLRDFVCSGGSATTFTQSGAGATSRTVQSKISDIVSVLDFGAKCDGSTDDTTAIQNAINAASDIDFPAATCNISAAITVSGPKTIRGRGSLITQIVQTNLTANAFNVNNSGNNGGGIRDLAIRGNAPFFNAPGSSGIALNLSNTGENFIINNVWIRNFDIGVKFTNGVFSNYIHGLTIDYFQTYGIWIAPVSTGAVSNDNRFSQIKIQNINFVQANGSTPNTPVALASPPNANSQIGIFYQESGGDVWQNVDILSTGSALVLQPPTTKAIAYLTFTDMLADASVYDNITLDGSLASVNIIQFTDIWGAFSTNGSGLVTKGSNLHMVQINGGRLRQNGKHGWDHQGGTDINLIGVSITGNSKLTTLTYHGVNVGANVSNWSLIGCRIGNISDGTTNNQLDNIHVAAGTTDNYTIVNNDLSGQGSGGQAMNNPSSGIHKTVRGNLPKQNAVDVVSSTFMRASSVIAQNSTGFLGSGGFSTNESDTHFTAHKALQVLRWGVAFTSAPGAGQSYSFQISLNGVLQGSPVVASGAGVFSIADQFSSLNMNEYDTITIKLITSATAAGANFRYFLEYSE